MPDDLTAQMQARGAIAVTIRAPLYDPATGLERMQRAAAWRQPMDHCDGHKIDRLHALWLKQREPEVGEPDKRVGLNARQYQNACAVLRLLRVVERSKGVAGYIRAAGASGGAEAGPQDAWNDLVRNGGVGFQAVCMLVRDEDMGPYMFGRAMKHLDTLDRIALEWEGERWREE